MVTLLNTNLERVVASWILERSLPWARI